MGKPDADDVVNKSSIEDEMGIPFGDEMLFVEGVKDSGPGRCRGYAHASRGDLAPVSITKFNNAVVEYNTERVDKCLYVGGWLVVAEFLLDKLGYGCEISISFDVGVH